MYYYDLLYPFVAIRRLSMRLLNATQLRGALTQCYSAFAWRYWRDLDRDLSTGLPILRMLRITQKTSYFPLMQKPDDFMKLPE